MINNAKNWILTFFVFLLFMFVVVSGQCGGHSLLHGRLQESQMVSWLEKNEYKFKHLTGNDFLLY